MTFNFNFIQPIINMPLKKDNKPGAFFLNMHPLKRIAISIITALVMFFLISKKMPVLMNAMLVWDVFSVCYIILSWIVVIKRPISEIRKLAKKDDGSVIFVFALIIVSSFASMFTVLQLMLSHKNSPSPESLYLPVALSGMMLSWMMVHTIYTFHYAHMYYR